MLSVLVKAGPGWQVRFLSGEPPLWSEHLLWWALPVSGWLTTETVRESPAELGAIGQAL